MYSIPMTGSMKYLIRPAMPGYSFDGTTDFNLEFGPKTCPVEYRQASGVVDTDMLNLYMDRLPRAMVAVMQPPGQKQAVMAKTAYPGLLVDNRTDFVPVGARLNRSGTGISQSVAAAVTKSLLETECSANVIGVRGNDIGLADEAVLNLHVFNYLDFAQGQIVTSAAEIRDVVDNFRFKWKSAGLPMAASGDLQTKLTGKETLRPLDVVSPGGVQAMKAMLATRQTTPPGGAKRSIISFSPPGADSAQSSLLMENGLALVPVPRGVEIEVTTLAAPGCLLAASPARLTTNDDGLASFRVKAGSHAGKVRLKIRVVKNPAAPRILPSETIEIAVQPRLQGIDPKTEAPVVLEPIVLMNTIQATLLDPGPEPDVFRTTIQVGPQGVTHGNMDLAPGFKPALRTAPLPTPKARIEKAKPVPVQPQAPDISGSWKSSIGHVYEITQTGNSFTWHVASLNQRAEGTISGDSVKASWRGLIGRDSATGKIILDAERRAVRIEWSNGVTFRR
jgi:hypothetical protein